MCCVGKMNKFLCSNLIVVDMYSMMEMGTWWFKLMLEWLWTDLEANETIVSFLVFVQMM